jgi:hypothetical protein
MAFSSSSPSCVRKNYSLAAFNFRVRHDHQVSRFGGPSMGTTGRREEAVGTLKDCNDSAMEEAGGLIEWMSQCDRCMPNQLNPISELLYMAFQVHQCRWLRVIIAHERATYIIMMKCTRS